MKHLIKPRLNWAGPLSSSVAMHRAGGPKSATPKRESDQRLISYSKKARSTTHSTCSMSVQIGRGASCAPNRVSSLQIYQRLRAFILDRHVRKSEPYLENPALSPTIKLYI